MKKIWLKLISLFTAVTFIFPWLSWAFEPGLYPLASHAFTIQYGNKPIELPPKLGSIEKVFQGQNKTIIHIQDLHCNYEVQKNIAKIINLVAKNYLSPDGRTQTSGRIQGSPLLVGEEGGFGRINVEPIRSFPIPEIRETVSDYFVKQGKLTGAEYYAGTGKYPICLEGIETPKLYNNSLAAVRSFLNAESQGYVMDLREMLDGLKTRIYNQKLLVLDKARIEYREGKLDVLAYATKLKNFAERFLGEHRSPLQQYPNLENYLHLGKKLFQPGVEPDQLFREMDELDHALRESLYTTNLQRELDSQYHRLDVIEKLLNISASQAELREFRQEQEKFRVGAFVKFIQTVGNGPRMRGAQRDRSLQEIDPGIYALDHYLAKVEKFYRLADIRSQHFVINILKKMDAGHQTLAVIITGGFHTDGIMAELKKQNIGYVSIKPRLTKQDVANPYFSILQGKRLPIEKLLAKNQTILAPQVWMEVEDGRFAQAIDLACGVPAWVCLPSLPPDQQKDVMHYIEEARIEVSPINAEDFQQKAKMELPQDCRAYLAHLPGEVDVPVLITTKGARAAADIGTQISFLNLPKVGGIQATFGNFSTLGLVIKSIHAKATTSVSAFVKRITTIIALFWKQAIILPQNMTYTSLRVFAWLQTALGLLSGAAGIIWVILDFGKIHAIALHVALHNGGWVALGVVLVLVLAGIFGLRMTNYLQNPENSHILLEPDAAETKTIPSRLPKYLQAAAKRQIEIENARGNAYSFEDGPIRVLTADEDKEHAGMLVFNIEAFANLYGLFPAWLPFGLCVQLAKFVIWCEGIGAHEYLHQIGWDRGHVLPYMMNWLPIAGLAVVFIGAFVGTWVVASGVVIIALWAVANRVMNGLLSEHVGNESIDAQKLKLSLDSFKNSEPELAQMQAKIVEDLARLPGAGEVLEKLADYFLLVNRRLSAVKDSAAGIDIRPGTTLEEDVKLIRNVKITGKNVRVRKGTTLENVTISGDDVTIGENNKIDGLAIRQNQIEIGNNNQFRGTVISSDEDLAGRDNPIANLKIGDHNSFGAYKIFNNTGEAITIGSYNRFADGSTMRSMERGWIWVGNHNKIGLDGRGVLSTSYNFGNRYAGPVMIGWGLNTKRGAELLGFGAYGFTIGQVCAVLEVSEKDLLAYLGQVFIGGRPDKVENFLAILRDHVKLPLAQPMQETVMLVGAVKPKYSIILGSEGEDQTTEIRDASRIQHSVIGPGANIGEKFKIYFSTILPNARFMNTPLSPMVGEQVGEDVIPDQSGSPANMDWGSYFEERRGKELLNRHFRTFHTISSKIGDNLDFQNALNNKEKTDEMLEKLKHEFLFNLGSATAIKTQEENTPLTIEVVNGHLMIDYQSPARSIKVEVAPDGILSMAVKINEAYYTRDLDLRASMQYILFNLHHNTARVLAEWQGRGYDISPYFHDNNLGSVHVSRQSNGSIRVNHSALHLIMDENVITPPGGHQIQKHTPIYMIYENQHPTLGTTREVVPALWKDHQLHVVVNNLQQQLTVKEVISFDDDNALGEWTLSRPITIINQNGPSEQKVARNPVPTIVGEENSDIETAPMVHGSGVGSQVFWRSGGLGITYSEMAYADYTLPGLVGARDPQAALMAAVYDLDAIKSFWRLTVSADHTGKPVLQVTPKNPEVLNHQNPNDVQYQAMIKPLMQLVKIGERLGYKEINVNMCCPARGVRIGGGGYELMLNPGLAEKVIREVSSAVQLPVSAKILLLPQKEDHNQPDGKATVALAHRLVTAGVNRLVIQAQVIGGHRNYPEVVKFISEQVKKPISYNGGIESLAPADQTKKSPEGLSLDLDSLRKYFAGTSVDRFMIGQVLLGSPWKLMGKSPTDLEIFDYLMPHARYLADINFGQGQVGLLMMKREILYYLQYLSDERREELSNQVESAAQIEAVLNVLEKAKKTLDQTVPGGPATNSPDTEQQSLLSRQTELKQSLREIYKEVDESLIKLVSQQGSFAEFASKLIEAYEFSAHDPPSLEQRISKLLDSWWLSEVTQEQIDRFIGYIKTEQGEPFVKQVAEFYAIDQILNNPHVNGAQQPWPLWGWAIHIDGDNSPWVVELRAGILPMQGLKALQANQSHDFYDHGLFMSEVLIQAKRYLGVDNRMNVHKQDVFELDLAPQSVSVLRMKNLSAIAGPEKITDEWVKSMMDAIKPGGHLLVLVTMASRHSDPSRSDYRDAVVEKMMAQDSWTLATGYLTDNEQYYTENSNDTSHGTLERVVFDFKKPDRQSAKADEVPNLTKSTATLPESSSYRIAYEENRSKIEAVNDPYQGALDSLLQRAMPAYFKWDKTEAAAMGKLGRALEFTMVTDNRLRTLKGQPVIYVPPGLISWYLQGGAKKAIAAVFITAVIYLSGWMRYRVIKYWRGVMAAHQQQGDPLSSAADILARQVFNQVGLSPSALLLASYRALIAPYGGRTTLSPGQEKELNTRLRLLGRMVGRSRTVTMTLAGKEMRLPLPGNPPLRRLIMRFLRKQPGITLKRPTVPFRRRRVSFRESV